MLNWTGALLLTATTSTVSKCPKAQSNLHIKQKRYTVILVVEVRSCLLSLVGPIMTLP